MLYQTCITQEDHDYRGLEELSEMFNNGIFVEEDKPFAEYLKQESKKMGQSSEEYSL